MRRFLAGMIAVAGLAAADSGGVAAAASPSVVVELFTSQGCSSCPPADEILSGLADRPDIVALSFHVDYWDRLGWRDPFSLTAATERQYAYAGALGASQVYTPQIVVNGRVGVVGSRERDVQGAIAEGSGALTVAVALAVEGDAIRIAVPSLPAGAMVWLIGFQDGQATQVLRGENAGRTIVNRHNVLAILPVALDAGGYAQVAPPEADGVAVLVQLGDGSIVGAAQAALAAQSSSLPQ